MNSTTFETENKEVQENNPELECSTKNPSGQNETSADPNEELRGTQKAEKEEMRDQWILNQQKERIKKSNMSTKGKADEQERIEAALKELRKNGNRGLTWKELEVDKTLDMNAKIDLITPKTLIIGLDVGKNLHYIRAFDKEGRELTRKDVLKFNNREEGYELALSWIENYQIQFGFEQVVVGLEPTGHYWFGIAHYFLENGITPVLVNPNAVHASKELDDNSQEKNDRKDPKVIAGLVKDGRFSIPYLPEGNYAIIRECEDMRIELLEERTRWMNRLTRLVDIHFPEMKDVAGDLDSVTNLLILRNYPLPQDIMEVGANGLQKLFREHKLRGVGMKMALRYQHAAAHTVGNTTTPNEARFEINACIDFIQMSDEKLAHLEARYAEVARLFENVDKLLEIKGIGLVSLMDVLAEIGDPSRFNNSQQIFKLAGLVPVHQESGIYKGKYKISKRGRKLLRRNVFILVKGVVAHSPEWRELHEYYTTREKNPLTKMQSLMALAGKLIRVIFMIVKTGRSYDPKKLLADIRRPESKDGKVNA